MPREKQRGISLDNTIVIVGGGNAGMQVADSLRKGGFSGPIDMLCAEPHFPYQRPPLSKKFLEGKLEEKRLFLRPTSYYETKKISVHLSTTATAIDRQARIVTTASGVAFPYSKLVIATGARVRKLPDTDELGLHYIRGIDDVADLKAALTSPSKITLVGGGFIGLETAATLTTLGHSVTVVEAMGQIMPGLVAPEIADFFKRKHKSQGVNILEGVGVDTVEKTAAGYTLTLGDKSTLDADLVIVGIGVIANTELAATAGLAVERGILVDEFAQTSDPDIYAVGDCATGMHMRFGAPTRLESVQNAVDQAAVAAKSILGEPVAYDALPWFWSDQYDLKLQMAGLSRGYDDCIIRGDMASEKFSICYFKAGQLIAVDSVNAIADHMAAKRLLAAGTMVSKAQCADNDVPLKNLL